MFMSKTRAEHLREAPSLLNVVSLNLKLFPTYYIKKITTIIYE